MMRSVSRRRLLIAAAAQAAWPVCRARATPAVPAAAPAADADARKAAASQHFPRGPVFPPRPLAPWPVTTHRRVATDLPALLRGKVTALQLMFTGCSATCPIQGALFAQAQSLLAGTLPAAQFVSLSIDPLGDSPAALAAWLQRLSAGPSWSAVAPRAADVDAIVERLGMGGEKRPERPDPHVTQVYLLDHRAELVWRTEPLPPAVQIVEALRHFAALAPLGPSPLPSRVQR